MQIDRPVSAKMDRSGDHLRIVSNQTPRQNDHKDMVRGDDDNARFANVVLPHLGDAYALARWITGNRIDGYCGNISSYTSRCDLRALHLAYRWFCRLLTAAVLDPGK